MLDQSYRIEPVYDEPVTESPWANAGPLCVRCDERPAELCNPCARELRAPYLQLVSPSQPLDRVIDEVAAQRRQRVAFRRLSELLATVRGAVTP